MPAPIAAEGMTVIEGRFLLTEVCCLVGCARYVLTRLPNPRPHLG
jgi:hypothetical protein